MKFYKEVILIALPNVLLLFGLAAFFGFGVPFIAKLEKGERAKELRSVARNLKKGAKKDFVWEYLCGVVDGSLEWSGKFPNTMTWQDWEMRSKAARGSQWGCIDGLRNVGAVVWVRVDHSVFGCKIDLRPLYLAPLTAVTASLAILLLCFGTAMPLAKVIAYARARDDFLLASAHELSSPLFALRRMIPDDMQEAKTTIETMVFLVANLREFARRGKVNVRCSKFGLKKTIDRQLQLLKADLDDCEFAISLETADFQVDANEQYVAQIIWNILSNAIKYVPTGGSLNIRTYCKEDTAYLEISDNGPGMTPRQMRRAFDGHWRGREGISARVPGYGVGLCVARAIARLMDGELTLRANSPAGCIFTLSLPLATMEDDE